MSNPSKTITLDKLMEYISAGKIDEDEIGEVFPGGFEFTVEAKKGKTRLLGDFIFSHVEAKREIKISKSNYYEYKLGASTFEGVIIRSSMSGSDGRVPALNVEICLSLYVITKIIKAAEEAGILRNSTPIIDEIKEYINSKKREIDDIFNDD